MVVAARRHEHRAGPLGRDLKAEHIAIKAERALEIGNLEMDMADPHARIDDFGWLAGHDNAPCNFRDDPDM